MISKEANARIKINKLLEEAGWRFFDDELDKATIKLESSIKMNDLGDDFQNVRNGYIDFLLVDHNQNPLIVLEAKKENLHPLVGKKQARNYAISQKVKFIILSNGSLHYLWNIESGNPEKIQVFPSLESIRQYYQYQPENGDIAMSTVRPNLKAFGYLENLPEKCLASTGFAILTSKKSILSKFLYYSVHQEYMVEQMILKSDKGQYPSITSKDVAELMIYLPDLELQRLIVASIEEEVQLVEHNKSFNFNKN